MKFIWGWRGRDFRYLFCLIFLRRLTPCHVLCCCISWDSNWVLLVGFLEAFWGLGLGSVRILLILVWMARRVVFFRRFYSHALSMMWVRNCRLHLYADGLQIYTVDQCRDVNRLVALVNGDLQRILNWSRDNSHILNASKTQALLVSRGIRSEDVGSDVILGGDSVRPSDVDGRLSCRSAM
jgi:hypothetical protein